MSDDLGTMDLFDPEGGARQRDEAVQRVEAHNAAWVDETVEVLFAIASRQRFLTSEDVWAARRSTPREGRAMGAVMTRGKTLKWIAPTPDFVPSVIAHHHANPTRIWRSLIYRGTA